MGQPMPQPMPQPDLSQQTLVQPQPQYSVQYQAPQVQYQAPVMQYAPPQPQYDMVTQMESREVTIQVPKVIMEEVEITYQVLFASESKTDADKQTDIGRQRQIIETA